jgi:uncharacterized protein (TIRG00374 family)
LKRILQLSLVSFLTIFFLGLFLWKSNLRQVGHILASTNWLWLIVGVVVNFGALIFRTARWRLIISREDPPGFYPTFFANTIGYMLSTVLPIRAGDVARPALLARRSNVRFATALGTVLTERVLDLFAILLLFVTFCLTHWRGYAADSATADPFLIVRSAAIVGAAILVALFTFLVCLFFFGGAVRSLHERLGRILPQRFREPWMHFFDAFAQTLRITKDPGAFALVLLFTAGVWFCLTAQFWFAALAANRPLPFDAGLFLGGATTVGIAIPTPGGVGGFHKIAQWVLTTFYKFDIDSSVAVAILFHLVGTLPVVIGGLTLLAREGLRWSDLSKQTAVEKS